MESTSRAEPDVRRLALQALLVWLGFFGLVVILNGTPLFMAGASLRPWTYSATKAVLFDAVIYGAVFLVVPVALLKGRSAVRRPVFVVPLIVALVALGLRHAFPPSGIVVIAVLAYLHWRFDLSGLGVKLPAQASDVACVLVLALLAVGGRALSPQPWGWHPGVAASAGINRLLFNPASTTENLFYFGFLTARVRPWAGPWRTPVLIGLFYMVHEMTNPEYWYEGMNFPTVFIAAAVTAAVYDWARNTTTIWLSSGVGRFLTNLV